jgi:protein transport protein SEC61 subunit alpha
MTLPSYREESVYSVLNKYIPTAAMLGGITIGLLTVLGDLVNAMGSTTGILLSVSILFGYYEKLGYKKSKDIEY